MVDISKLLGKYGASPVVNTNEPPTNAPSNATTTNLCCDSCTKEFKDIELTLFKIAPHRSLTLCASCLVEEKKLLASIAEAEKTSYKDWPQCNKCGAHVKEPKEGLCSNCTPKPTKIDPILIKPTDSNKYQEFFNQTVTEIADMTVEDIREFIVTTSESIFSLEADLLREKARKQSALVKFNSILERMTLDERNKLRLEDSKYVPSETRPRKLANPAQQKAKVKKSLDEEINALFGGKLSPAEIAEKKKALGM